MQANHSHAPTDVTLKMRPFAYAALLVVIAAALLTYGMVTAERSFSATISVFSTRFLGIFY